MNVTEVHVRTALENVPLCGCGTTERMWMAVRDILARAAEMRAAWDRGDVRVTTFYDPMGEWPGSAVEFAAQALDTSGLMNHGGSIGSAQLTGAGKCVLLFLQKYGCEHGGWPEWATSSNGDEEHCLGDKEWREFKDSSAGTVEGVP